MIRLAVLGGTGDAYLVCALAREVERHHGAPVTILLRARRAAIPAYFGLPWEVNDAEIDRAESDAVFQRTYDNRLEAGRTFYAHPCFTNSGARLDDLTILPGPISQAGMYRALLDLPEDAPLERMRFPRPELRPDAALLITRAVSWPNGHPAFWRGLEQSLRAGGWSVTVDDGSSPLSDLLTLAAGSGLIAGPQCGAMSIFVAEELPGRKVIATSSIDDGPGFPVGRRRLRWTFPYAYVTKFTGNDYDVDEYRVTATDQAEIVASIVTRSRIPHDPAPRRTIDMPLPYGEFFDRLAILDVKHRRGLPVDREWRRYREAAPALTDDAARIAYSRLVDLHSRTFDHLQYEVPRALEDESSPHHTGVRLNRMRIECRRRIDELTAAPYTEVKEYYGP